MKKALSILLAVLMAFCLFACNASTDDSQSAGSTDGDETAAGSQSENEAESNSSATSEEIASGTGLGFYDPDADYYARDAYKIVYVMSIPSITSEIFGNAFELWGTRLNYEYSNSCANGDNDAYVTNIEVLATQGYDGYLLECDPAIADRVYEVLTELELNWMPAMLPMQDSDGNMLHPYIAMDSYQMGQNETIWLSERATEEWGDIDLTTLGMIGCDYSAVPDIHNRIVGASDKFEELYPEIAETNYWEADGVTTGSMTAEASYNMVGTIMAAQPQIEYWIIASAIDDYAAGAARAADAADKADNTLIISIGGDTLFNEWDSDNTSCWEAAVYTAPMLYTEGMACGLIALIDGTATPETLWPEYINEGAAYATVTLKSEILTYEIYQEYLEWVDYYTGTDVYDYEYSGTEYQPR